VGRFGNVLERFAPAEAGVLTVARDFEHACIGEQCFLQEDFAGLLIRGGEDQGAHGGERLRGRVGEVGQTVPRAQITRIQFENFVVKRASIGPVRSSLRQLNE